MITQVFVSALLGALLATGIALISRSGMGFLAGLIPLFPAFALFAHIRAFDFGGPVQVKHVALFGLVSLVPYAGYLLTLILLVNKVELRIAITAAVGLWLILAVIGVAVWDAIILPRLTQDV